MIFRAFLPMTLVILVTLDARVQALRAESEICNRLKEISSVNPDKNPIFDYKTHEQRCRLYYWREFRPLPLSRVLNESERANYMLAIANGKCDRAAALLSRRFVEAHPKAPSILKSKSDYRDWRISTVSDHFPKLALCFNLKAIQKAQDEINRLGLSATPYAGHKKSVMSTAAKALPWPVQHRHRAIFRMHRSLGRTLSPSIALALLKLSVEGKALKYHELNELYLAFRLRISSQRDPVIQQIIDRQIDVHLKDEIERKAKSGQFQGIPQYPD